MGESFARGALVEKSEARGVNKQGTANATCPVVRVYPAQKWNGLNWREIWERRELVAALVRRDLQVRYRQTVAGVLWVLGQPLITTLVLSLLLMRLAGQTQVGVPYPLFVYVGLTAWAYISHGLTKAATCFVEHAPLVQRVYLPRLIVPFAVTLAALADFGVALAFLPVLMLWFHAAPSPAILALPLVIVLMVVTVFGLGVWLATFNAEFRDIAFALPFALQLGLFVSPMFYSSEIIPPPLRWVYALNPVVGIVESLRWTLLSPTAPAPLLTIAISSVSACVILLGGLYVFQRREPMLADVI
jgi:lipopolysaccharide transport system permease protein